MNVVILGYIAHPFTRALVKKCQQRGIRIKALVQEMRVAYPPELVLQNLKSDGLLGQNLFKEVLTFDNLKRAFYNPGFALGFLIRWLGRKRRPSDNTQVNTVRTYRSADADFRELTVKTVDNHNSVKCEKVLQELSTDLLILGPAQQIIRSNILRIPRIGTLNVHEGILPQYRGMDLLEYSILSGDEPGITVHFVDPGVDTGDIILRQHVEMSGINTLEDLWQRAVELAVEALVEAIIMIEQGNYEREPQDPVAGKQYYPIHPTLRHIVHSKLEQRNRSVA